MEVIITQIIVTIINAYIAYTENKKNIYIVNFLFNFANLIMYLSNGDKTTAIIYIVISVRSFIYIYKDKINNIVIPIICILVQLLVGLTTIENLWQLIPILVPCYACYYMWFNKTTQQLRINNSIAFSLWCIYNIQTGLYIVAISRFITVVNNIIAYNRHKNINIQNTQKLNDKIC